MIHILHLFLDAIVLYYYQVVAPILMVSQDQHSDQYYHTIHLGLVDLQDCNHQLLVHLMHPDQVVVPTIVCNILYLDHMMYHQAFELLRQAVLASEMMSDLVVLVLAVVLEATVLVQEVAVPTVQEVVQVMVLVWD
jgi:hypothetical protein